MTRPDFLRLALVSLFLTPVATWGDEPKRDVHETALDTTLVQAVDRALESHWRERSITPAAVADDATLLRRVTLDLLGRAPTPRERAEFAADKSSEKYRSLVRRLLDSPEFAYYFGTVLDEAIQGRLAGGDSFVDYLRGALQARRGWDAVFREVLIGPWDKDATKPAAQFVEKRTKDIDQLTVDTTRAFLGVDISCARCHDHPLVDDWKQDHYYGMASFLNRPSGKGKNGDASDADVKFIARDGKERTARMMFLSGRTIEPPAAGDSASPGGANKPLGRREQLVAVTLEDRSFFSRAIVNRLWEYFLGRGLVHPVDQIHSGNPPSIPAVMETLSADFPEHGYDLRRLIGAIVLSRSYRASSVWGDASPAPEPTHFAVARLRALSPRQFAQSLLIACGDESFDQTDESRQRVERLIGVSGLSRVERLFAAEKTVLELTKTLDPRTADFQSSTREALFVSNSEAFRRAVMAQGDNLAGRAARIGDPAKRADMLFESLLGRAPDGQERAWAVELLTGGGENPSAGCESLVWALVASAEFRFNH